MILEDYVKLVGDNLAPLATTFLIAGLVKVYVYYKFFGIYILEFMNVKEVITLYISNLLTYFVFMILCLLLLYLRICIQGIGFYCIWLLILVCSTALPLFRKHIYIYETTLWNVFILAAFLSIDKFNFGQKIIHDQNSILYFQVLTFLIISMIIFSMIAAYTEFRKVKHKNYFLGTIINCKDFAQVSTIDNYYVGKTEKYVFFHNDVTNINEIIPVSKVEKFIFKKG